MFLPPMHIYYPSASLVRRVSAAATKAFFRRKHSTTLLIPVFRFLSVQIFVAASFDDLNGVVRGTP